MKWQAHIGVVAIATAVIVLSVRVHFLERHADLLQSETLTSRTNEMIALEWVQRVQKNVEDMQFSTLTLMTNDLHRMQREMER